MGVNCCSHAKESPDITITKPEKNMTSTSQNPIVKANKKVQNSFNQNNNINNIITTEVINTNNQKGLNQPLDVNNNNAYTSSQNSIFPLTEKEIDDLLNNIGNNNDNNNYQTNSQQQVINNNIINNNIQQKGENIQENKNNLVQNNQPDIEELKLPTNPQSQNLNLVNNLAQNEIIKTNQNNFQENNYINNNNININNNNDKYIDELLKNPSSGQNIHTNSNINLDVFFDQNDNIKIDDALIDKLFESAGKPIFQSTPPSNNSNNINNINNNEQLNLTQKMNNIPQNQIKGVNNNNYFSPVNSNQRSQISEPGNSKYKQIYDFK